MRPWYRVPRKDLKLSGLTWQQDHAWRTLLLHLRQ